MKNRTYCKRVDSKETAGQGEVGKEECIVHPLVSGRVSLNIPALCARSKHADGRYDDCEMFCLQVKVRVNASSMQVHVMLIFGKLKRHARVNVDSSRRVDDAIIGADRDDSGQERAVRIGKVTAEIHL